MRRALLLVVAGGVFSCTFDIPDVVPRDGGARSDGPEVVDAAFDGIQFRDGTSEGATDGPVATVYNDMTVAANWKTFDTSMVTGGGSTQFYSGGAFDGRYVYLAPTAGVPPSSIALQFDTIGAAGFAGKASWSHFDTMQVSTAAGGFWGATYDGAQFIYFTPYALAASSTSAADGLLVRNDTQSTFASGGSWADFNATMLNTGAQGFSGQAFDGQYIYFAPNFAGSSMASGLVARFDTKAGFAAGAGAWTFFDALVNVSPLAAGFIGAVFDGRYVTFVPNATTVALQYDTHGQFLQATSWASFNVGMLGGMGTQSAFAGGVYDGHYVYLVPEYYVNGSTLTFGSIVARHDPSMGFNGGWTLFDVSSVNPMARGFGGGAFDGRYVYLVPEGNTGTTASTGQFTPNGLIARYDTTQSFETPGSWTTFDIKSNFGTTVAGFFGAVFDGRYLYLVPEANTTVARFDARTPPAMPALPAFHGSFF